MQAQVTKTAADITTTIDNKLSIYVAGLADYNSGILHGRWISCTQGSAHVWEQIHEMLSESPAAAKYGNTAEEWARSMTSISWAST